ncbi:Hypothetical protein AA314_09022 [Archangium gephyra]|uniref:Uncharacterized protein n=1 Tax=Archangium gephyra TaxID=48 RepID=A0AAC8TK10_9BACT|nr:Hypothetical protein AA314_09022 [Archangium gephyra]
MRVGGRFWRPGRSLRGRRGGGRPLVRRSETRRDRVHGAGGALGSRRAAPPTRGGQQDRGEQREGGQSETHAVGPVGKRKRSE